VFLYCVSLLVLLVDFLCNLVHNFEIQGNVINLLIIIKTKFT